MRISLVKNIVISFNNSVLVSACSVFSPVKTELRKYLCHQYPASAYY